LQAQIAAYDLSVPRLALMKENLAKMAAVRQVFQYSLNFPEYSQNVL
jgi:hypothetical protein